MQVYAAGTRVAGTVWLHPLTDCGRCSIANSSLSAGCRPRVLQQLKNVASAWQMLHNRCITVSVLVLNLLEACLTD